MTKKPFAVIAMLAVACAPSLVSAEESGRRASHGYGGGGLMLSAATLDFQGGSSTDSDGGGVFASGAGLFNVASVLGIGVNGGFLVGARTYDTDVDAVEAQFAVDGGVVLWDILYLSVGVQSYAYTIEDPVLGDVTFSYAVVPLGVGIFKATDRGYLLAQLRFGGGEADEDYANTTEDLGYVGIHLMGQIGAANGVQFLGGVALDDFDFKDSDGTDSYFRVFLGVAFGT